MLVDNKFLYISLPRCASTSFMITCIKNDIQLNHFDTNLDVELKKINKNLNSEELSNQLLHAHERCRDLTNKFGNKFDIISVKRNRYQRFISTWEHIIDILDKFGDYEASNTFKQLDESVVLGYDKSELIDEESLLKHISSFLNENNITSSIDMITHMLRFQFLPMSYWHNNHPNIIWFDFDKLYELEEWVSDKLGKQFRLEKSNSSKHIECNLKLTNNFIKKYDEIYNTYDFVKTKKTIL